VNDQIAPRYRSAERRPIRDVPPDDLSADGEEGVGIGARARKDAHAVAIGDETSHEDFADKASATGY
jgi:hypothetical protein